MTNANTNNVTWAVEVRREMFAQNTFVFELYRLTQKRYGEESEYNAMAKTIPLLATAVDKVANGRMPVFEKPLEVMATLLAALEETIRTQSYEPEPIPIETTEGTMKIASMGRLLGTLATLTNQIVSTKDTPKEEYDELEQLLDKLLAFVLPYTARKGDTVPDEDMGQGTVESAVVNYTTALRKHFLAVPAVKVLAQASQIVTKPSTEHLQLKQPDKEAGPEDGTQTHPDHAQAAAHDGRTGVQHTKIIQNEGQKTQNTTTGMINLEGDGDPHETDETGEKQTPSPYMTGPKKNTWRIEAHRSKHTPGKFFVYNLYVTIAGGDDDDGSERLIAEDEPSLGAMAYAAYLHGFAMPEYEQPFVAMQSLITMLRSVEDLRITDSNRAGLPVIGGTVGITTIGDLLGAVASLTRHLAATTTPPTTLSLRDDTPGKYMRALLDQALPDETNTPNTKPNDNPLKIAMCDYADFLQQRFTKDQSQTAEPNDRIIQDYLEGYESPATDSLYNIKKDESEEEIDEENPADTDKGRNQPEDKDGKGLATESMNLALKAGKDATLALLFTEISKLGSVGLHDIAAYIWSILMYGRSAAIFEERYHDKYEDCASNRMENFRQDYPNFAIAIDSLARHTDRWFAKKQLGGTASMYALLEMLQKSLKNNVKSAFKELAEIAPPYEGLNKSVDKHVTAAEAILNKQNSTPKQQLDM